MSKRPLEKSTESREERWLRKKKWYEEKIDAKRRKRAAQENLHHEPQGQQTLLAVSRDVQNEEQFDYNVDVAARPSDSEVELPNTNDVPPNYEQLPQDEIEIARRDIAYEEDSVMTKTTACTSPTNSFCDETDENVAVVDGFDPELLRELGDVETDPAEFGDNLQPDVAARFQKILQEGIKKQIKEDLLKKYPCPKNVPLAKSPTLNPEIGAMLPETCKLRDKRLLTKQDQLGKALSALGKALTGLLKKNPDIPETIRTLNDAGILLADSHYAETDTRRTVIIPLIDKSLTDPFKDRKRDSFLFGEKLGDLVKDSRGIKKTGQLIQPSTSSSTNLNGRALSSRGTQQQRGSYAYQNRAGGARAATTAPPYQYPNRRRAAAPPPPPPPAPRRYQAPMPPPPARRPLPPSQRPANRQ